MERGTAFGLALALCVVIPMVAGAVIQNFWLGVYIPIWNLCLGFGAFIAGVKSR